ncbi:MAG: PQQ-dependent sugar dehydrogenase [Anaerolineae bacterium]|nr:PQQ-dependent sugar dehydrogenase [Anaerolineae bacterium]
MRYLFRLMGLITLITVLGIYPQPAMGQVLPTHLINLPHGFKISTYAQNIPQARMMALSPSGTLFIGTRTDTVYAIPNATSQNYATQIIAIQTPNNVASGVAFRNGALYVGADGVVLRYDNIEANLNNPPTPVIVNDTVPASHGARTIRFGPDDKLYIKVGAPCNVCEESAGPYSATIVRMNPDGTNIEIYVRGTRNAVGYDWHPVTGDLWFTNNGRDGLGDEIPPETLNRATTIGQNFGFPYCHSGYIVDPEFGHLYNCNQFVAPAQLMPAHTAPLGMRFYTGDSFPTEYMNQAFIAEHGSWNRSSRIGYRISLVRLNAQSEAISYETFADGWLQPDENVWGRPVDVQVMPDGAMLISDDYANAIYRVNYICSLAGFGGQTFGEQDLQYHIQNHVDNRPAEWSIQNAFIDLVNCGILAVITLESGEIGWVKVSIADGNGLMQITVDKMTQIDGISPVSMAYDMTIRNEFIPIIMQSLNDLIGDAGDNGFSQVAITSQTIELMAQP